MGCEGSSAHGAKPRSTSSFWSHAGALGAAAAGRSLRARVRAERRPRLGPSVDGSRSPSSVATCAVAFLRSTESVSRTARSKEEGGASGAADDAGVLR